ncbi:MAG TPA: hypothetical protein VFU94_03415, partial [Conexibacter sp.]|nr:hypothetical protein [Conexibacter sp.]
MRRGAMHPAGRGRAASRLALALVLLLPLAHGPNAGAAVPANGRAWELVTTAPTNGANVFGTRAWSDDGTRVAYVTLGPPPDAPSGDLLAVAVATREPGGWVDQPTGEPYTQPLLGFADGPFALGGDFASWGWQSSVPLLPGAPPAPRNAYYRRAPDG